MRAQWAMSRISRFSERRRERWGSNSWSLLSRDLSDTELFAALLGVPKVVLYLLTEPALRRGTKGDRQPHRHLRADAGATIQNRR